MTRNLQKGSIAFLGVSSSSTELFDGEVMWNPGLPDFYMTLPVDKEQSREISSRLGDQQETNPALHEAFLDCSSTNEQE